MIAKQLCQSFQTFLLRKNQPCAWRVQFQASHNLPRNITKTNILILHTHVCVYVYNNNNNNNLIIWMVCCKVKIIHTKFQLSTFSNPNDDCSANINTTKVETPYHDNDLILTPIISPQSGWQWTWSCLELHMGGFRNGGWQILTFGRCH